MLTCLVKWRTNSAAQVLVRLVIVIMEEFNREELLETWPFMAMDVLYIHGMTSRHLGHGLSDFCDIFIYSLYWEV